MPASRLRGRTWWLFGSFSTWPPRSTLTPSSSSGASTRAIVTCPALRSIADQRSAQSSPRRPPVAAARREERGEVRVEALRRGDEADDVAGFGRGRLAAMRLRLAGPGRRVLLDPPPPHRGGEHGGEHGVNVADRPGAELPATRGRCRRGRNRRRAAKSSGLVAAGIRVSCASAVAGSASGPRSRDGQRDGQGATSRRKPGRGARS